MSQRNDTPRPSVPLANPRTNPSVQDPTAALPRTTAAANPDAATSARKVCAYITRDDDELLVFDGPGHDDLQIPKGTVEGDEPLREALHREVREETGLDPSVDPTHVATDVWTRRHHPPRHYVRHFYHVDVDEPRDAWTHTVTGSGEEAGAEFDLRWLELPTDVDFALALDDYLPALRYVD